MPPDMGKNPVSLSPLQPQELDVVPAAVFRQSEERAMRLETAFLREHELLERIFDTVPLMMTIYEPGTKVLRVNRAFERLIGWSSAELADISLMEQCYPDPEYREQAQEYMQACRPEWRDFRVRTRDGGEIQSSWTNIRLPDDRQLGIGLDITDRKEAEAALRESEDMLRRADRLKDEFLATLAHELRNPLAPMRTAVDILRSEGTSRHVADQALSVLDRRLALMVRLVDDLLDISRITMGRIDLRPGRVDLGAVVQEAVEGNQPLFRANQQQFIYRPSSGAPVFVDGDPTRLEQVFANLLQNAAKFTPAGGTIFLECGREGDEAVVRVRDTGIGIAPDILPRVFEMFVQVDRSVDRERGGLGIGLSLVKRLVELHGGRVEAFSAGAGQGSQFTVRLPSPAPPRLGPGMPAENPAPHVPASGSADRPRRTVLVVDDNVDAAQTLAQLLSAWGHDVLVAHDGRSGIDLARSSACDVIVMDLAMPGMSGYSAARRIRADANLTGVLLVALTGWGQPEARLESAQAGFDHHLVKPAETSVLRDILCGPIPGRHG